MLSLSLPKSPQGFGTGNGWLPSYCTLLTSLNPRAFRQPVRLLGRVLLSPFIESCTSCCLSSLSLIFSSKLSMPKSKLPQTSILSRLLITFSPQLLLASLTNTVEQAQSHRDLLILLSFAPYIKFITMSCSFSHYNSGKKYSYSSPLPWRLWSSFILSPLRWPSIVTPWPLCLYLAFYQSFTSLNPSPYNVPSTLLQWHHTPWYSTISPKTSVGCPL